MFQTLVKRLTAVSLAALIAAGSSSLMVNAKTFEDVNSDHTYTEQIDLLSDIGVILGTSETEFSPEEPVTREQMALLLYRLMLGRNNAGSVNSSPFTDITDETYFGAISWAYASGYILGTGENSYDPRGGITMQDAMTVLVRALGQSNANMNKGYPWTYIDAGLKLELDNQLEGISYTQTLTRGQVAALLYNALTAEYLIPKTASNGMTYLEKTSIIENVFGYEIKDAVVTATNNYAIGLSDTVVKNGFVTLTSEDGSFSVNFEELGLDGTPDAWLGRELRVICKSDAQNKLVNVLGAVWNGRSERVTTAAFEQDNKSVTLGSQKYNVVETLSDSLATNANELLVFAYDNDGKLTQITSNAALANLLGYFEIELIFDSKSSETADRAIVKNYTFGKLDTTNSKINLAGGLTEAELTGGYSNKAEASHGDYVLFYYNPAVKSLEISEKLTPSAGFVSKISGGKATIGGTEYTIGFAQAGVDPASLLASITIGRDISFIAKDGKLLAIVNAPVVVSDSQYLVTTSNAIPVFTNGSLQYVVNAIINGSAAQIIVTDPTITQGNVYRYIQDANGVYALFARDSAYFTQSHEFSTHNEISENTTISHNSLPYYTFAGINFVTDANTLILVNNNGTLETHKGIFNHTIDINAGATVTAVHLNKPGTVDCLSFLYVSNGHIANATATTSFVKILAPAGHEYVNGTVYTIYSVYNFQTGTVENRLSIHGDLTANAVLALDTNAFISTTEAGEAHIEGTVTGYTGTTVTIGEQVYALDANVKIVTLNGTTVTAKTIADAYQQDVEVITNGTAVTSIIIKPAASAE
ncbi:MAG: S-layer homology domain-containing protein [Clostridia bacterium]|nr:S-layer homology domain-containing protein [Clostridia bacterium]